MYLLTLLKASCNDDPLYLKHNLNARVIDASIKEAKSFLQTWMTADPAPMETDRWNFAEGAN